MMIQLLKKSYLINLLFCLIGFNFVVSFAIAKEFGLGNEVPVTENLNNLSFQQILDKYYEAVGGYGNMESLQSMRVKTVLERGKSKLEMVVIKKKPDKIRIAYNFPESLNVSVMGYNGRYGWSANGTSMSNLTSAEYLGESQTEMLKSQTNLFPYLFNPKEKGAALIYLGISKVDGKVYYKIKAVTDEKITLYYLNKDTFQLDITLVKEYHEGEDKTFKTVFTDYRRDGNFILAHKNFVYSDGKLQSTFYINEIKYDVGLFTEYFDMPKIQKVSAGNIVPSNKTTTQSSKEITNKNAELTKNPARQATKNK